jgi:hypothetical protein
MREQLRTMSGQLEEMQQEGRPWVGPVGATPVSKDRNEPLSVTLGFRNYGRQPATFVRSKTATSYFLLEAGKRIEDLSGWKDPKWFSPQASCHTASFYQAVYPSDAVYSFEVGPSEDNPIKGNEGETVSAQTMFDAITQKHRLYVIYGCFTYVATGKREFTTFCLMLDPRTIRDIDTSTWKFVFCPFGNDNGELAQEEAKEQDDAKKMPASRPSP